VRLGGAFVAVATALTLLGFILVPTSSPRASAAAVLQTMAKLAEAQSASVPGPGQYLYSQSASRYQVTLYQPNALSDTFVPTATAQFSETERTWARSDGSGSGLLIRSPLEFASTTDQMEWQQSAAASSYLQSFQRSIQEPDLTAFAPDISSLPSDPSSLASVLAQGAGPSNPALIPDGPAAVFERAARLLVGPTVGLSPALAAGLYDVMAEQPGVSLLGSTTDHQGRTGTSVSVTTPQGVSEVIFDQHDAKPLEASFISPQSSIAAPSPGGTVQICPTTTTCAPGPGAQNQIVQSPLWVDNIASSIVAKSGDQT
jgi:hypothetical protein